MTKDAKHIEKMPNLDQEIMKMISGTRINWSKTKEDIWSEMLIKAEGLDKEDKNPKQFYLNMKRLAVAAMLLIVLGIPAVIYSYTKTVKTFLSQPKEVLLPDNSKVIVYEQSVLSYKPILWRFSRTIHLEGEAFFDVKKGRKFEVVSKKGKVDVLGTQFDVYTRGSDYSVICFSGKVKVTESEHQNVVVLTAGQKTILKKDGNLEIIRNDIQPENPNNLPDKVSEDEKNKTSSKSIAPAQAIKNEFRRIPEAEQTESNVEAKQRTKEEAQAMDPSRAVEENIIKEQNPSQNQILEELQNQIHSKSSEQVQDKKKEGEMIQNQGNKSNQKTGSQQNQDKFRDSLTPEQIKILENEKMSREEKQKAFMESLSAEQRELLKERNQGVNQSVKDNMNESVESNKVKEQQQIQMQEQNRKIRNRPDRGEQRQQNRDNRMNNKVN